MLLPDWKPGNSPGDGRYKTQAAIAAKHHCRIGQVSDAPSENTIVPCAAHAISIWALGGQNGGF